MKPRYCDKCGLGLATNQTTETCPRCNEPKFRCDRCRTAFAPLTAWPMHPRQGYACCPYCGDVVTKYVRKTCPECDGTGRLPDSPASPDEPCVACGCKGHTWVTAT
jgi:hypothetical protein